MIKKVRNFFKFIEKSSEWLSRKNLLRIKNYTIPAAIWFVLLIVLIYTRNTEHIDFLQLIFQAYIFCLFPLAFIIDDGEWKFTGGKAPREWINKFTNFSFVIGLLVFVIFMSLGEIGVLKNLFEAFHKYEYSNLVSENVVFLIYFNIIIYTLMWFGYHLINGEVSIKAIKTKLSLFLAVSTTLSVILLSFDGFSKEFKSIFACLGIGYAWIKYLIDCKESE